MSNAYIALQERQQQEVNRFPIGAAFGNNQFREMMERWGFTENDTDKILSLGGGCYIRKSDKDAYTGMCKRHHEELAAAIEEDKTGEGFIYQMFYEEMAAHEYGYTGDLEETLDALHMTMDQVNADKRLIAGLLKAVRAFEGADVFGEEDKAV